MRFLLAAAALLAATPAFATDWTLAAEGEGESTAVFLDRDSIEKLPGSMVRVWIFYAFAKDKGEGVAGIAARQEYDCANTRYRRLFLRTYDASAAVKVEGELVTEWKQNQPGDLGSTIQAFVCSGGAEKPGAKMLGAALPLAYARRELF